jgi:hypothetical protein
MKVPGPYGCIVTKIQAGDIKFQEMAPFFISENPVNKKLDTICPIDFRR